MKFRKYENKYVSLTIDLDEVLSIVCNYDTPHGFMSVMYKSNSTELQLKTDEEFMKEIEKDISRYLLNHINN